MHLPLVARRHDVQQQHGGVEVVKRAHPRVGPLDLARAIPCGLGPTLETATRTTRKIPHRWRRRRRRHRRCRHRRRRHPRSRVGHARVDGARAAQDASDVRDEKTCGRRERMVLEGIRGDGRGDGRGEGPAEEAGRLLSGLRLEARRLGDDGGVGAGGELAHEELHAKNGIHELESKDDSHHVAHRGEGLDERGEDEAHARVARDEAQRSEYAQHAHILERCELRNGVAQ
mmetsp:Transcript_9396/g.19230  ORF Transcript_9396/g.19230 Transcript_9396/m.19230 type:complete len:230 (+) Transcript_9396:286-975(+)